MKIERYNLTHDQWIYLINQWIFNETDRHILRRKLLDGVTFERLAEEVDLSVQQTKTRTYRALNELLKRVN